MFTPKLNARFPLSITSIKFHVAVQEGSDCGWLVCEHFLKGLGLDRIGRRKVQKKVGIFVHDVL